jgi:hypothetical protein
MPKGKDAIERVASEESDNEISLKGYDILTSLLSGYKSNRFN